MQQSKRCAHEALLSRMARAVTLTAGLVLLTVSTVVAAGIADSDITYWVKDALRNDARVDASSIEVSTNQGVVTLSGVVDNLAAQNYAKLETTKINGVVGLVDEITVEPQYRSDSDIRNAVRRRTLNSPVIESEGVTVTVVTGLSGFAVSLLYRSSLRRLAGASQKVWPEG